MMSMNLGDFVIVNIKSAGCHCVIKGISKFESISLMENANLTKKVEQYKT